MYARRGRGGFFRRIRMDLVLSNNQLNTLLSLEGYRDNLLLACGRKVAAFMYLAHDGDFGVFSPIRLTQSRLFILIGTTYSSVKRDKIPSSAQTDSQGSRSAGGSAVPGSSKMTAPVPAVRTERSSSARNCSGGSD